MVTSDIKTCLVVVFLFVLSSKVFIREIDAEGDCGDTPIWQEALSLMPCQDAGKNATIEVPAACCTKVEDLLKTSPNCLCERNYLRLNTTTTELRGGENLLEINSKREKLSGPVGQAGVKPEIAITIPKRCNIQKRYAGKKCGEYLNDSMSPDLHPFFKITSRVCHTQPPTIKDVDINLS
ncbi:hypothetical protein CJ030_MR5G003639 [Morella rubra]|uniref:Bifunctional inhibitor/plant lipid transfer protein/seed storage helical domain-containing protein n=1 Tax=Morella rubra TaxID=262757 RepID=A0A6A1VK99_9ROSI|nr:hypothetical protein CJ030_MR5G003639 [Morella rubra]